MTMLTEQEAREKWCPFVRASAAYVPMEGNHACNRWAADGPGGEPALNPPDARCIASDCMAWRWLNGYPADPNKNGMGPDGKWLGYCGLAGKPDA